MNQYQRMIIEDTGCTPGEVHEIEDIMRHDVFHSTLDWQTRDQFREGARQAYRIYKNLPDSNPDPSTLIDLIEQNGGVVIIFHSADLNGHDPKVFKALLYKLAKEIVKS